MLPWHPHVMLGFGGGGGWGREREGGWVLFKIYNPFCLTHQLVKYIQAFYINNVSFNAFLCWWDGMGTRATVTHLLLCRTKKCMTQAQTHLPLQGTLT